MSIPVEVKILDQKLIVRTEEDEEYAKKAADYTNDKIQEIRDNTKVASKLDIALLAAMNIAGEYIKTRDRLLKLESKTNRLVEFIDAKVLYTASKIDPHTERQNKADQGATKVRSEA